MTLSNALQCWHVNSWRCNKDESNPMRLVNRIDLFFVEVAEASVGPSVGASVAGSIGLVVIALENPL